MSDLPGDTRNAQFGFFYFLCTQKKCTSKKTLQKNDIFMTKVLALSVSHCDMITFFGTSFSYRFFQVTHRGVILCLYR